MRAVHFGVVFRYGEVTRIFNPDFEFELAIHHVNSDEQLVLLSKREFGIPLEPNAMTLKNVHDITRALGQKR